MAKKRIFKLVEKGSHGKRMNRVFDYFIMSVILLSVVVIILESVPEIYSEYNTILTFFNIFSLVVFTIEYFLRLYISDLTHPSDSRLRSGLKFIFSGYGLIDLFAILPFYLPMLISIDLRFIRILRLTRLFRILKVNRYNNSLKLIWSVFQEKKSELAVTGFLTLLILFLSSFLMYYAEGDVQPDKFPNIIATFWWAIATLTTVGYGDVYPITDLGKIISSLIAVLGIGIVALPTGLISAGFMSKIDNNKSSNNDNNCPHCGKKI